MWTVYRIEMPATTREQYMQRGSAEMRGYAQSLVVISGDACAEVCTREKQADAIDAARAEFDRTGRSCIVRQPMTHAEPKNER